MTNTRWEKLSAFVAQWHGPLGEEAGYSAEELKAVEQELGIAFPEALREWYALAGRWYYGLQVQDYQLELDELDVDEGILVFQVENQEVCVWSVHEADFAQPDPPVYDEENEAVQAEHLSDFLLCSVIKETAIVRCEEPEMGLGTDTIFAALNTNLTLWFADGDFERYYATDDAIAIAGKNEDGQVWLMLSAKTAAASAHYKTLLGKDIAWQ